MYGSYIMLLVCLSIKFYTHIVRYTVYVYAMLCWNCHDRLTSAQWFTFMRERNLDTKLERKNGYNAYVRRIQIQASMHSWTPQVRIIIHMIFIHHSCYMHMYSDIYGEIKDAMQPDLGKKTNTTLLHFLFVHTIHCINIHVILCSCNLVSIEEIYGHWSG